MAGDPSLAIWRRSAARAMQAHRSSDRSQAEHGGRLGYAEVVQRDEHEHRALAIGKSRDGSEHGTGLSSSVDPLLHALNVVIAEQATASTRAFARRSCAARRCSATTTLRAMPNS